jgi:hypothetical protein
MAGDRKTEAAVGGHGILWRVCLSAGLNVAGFFFEVGGLWMTAAEFIRIERRAFPERSGGLRRTVLRGLHRLRRHETVHSDAALGRMTAGGTASGTATLTAERIPATPTIEERVARLERQIADLREEHEDAKGRIHARIGEVEQRAEARAQEAHQRISAQEAAQREELDDSLTLRKVGVSLFAAGALLSLVGNTLPC